MMIENLRSRGLELRGLHAHPTLESTAQRFKSRGWRSALAVDLADYHDKCVQKDELARLAKIEFLDEWEEFRLLAQHYAFTLAFITMPATEVQVAGAAALGLSLYYSLNRYVDGCHVKVLTASEGSSRLIKKGPDGEEVSIRRLLETQCPSLTDPDKAFMIPTPYLCGGMLQTVYSTMKALKEDQYSNIKYDRELREMEDKGTISIDWYPKRSEDPNDKTPIVVIMPGVGGSSYEYHIRYLAKALAGGPLKYRVAVMNHRGCGRTPLTSPKLYNAYHTDDYRAIVAYIHSCFEQAKLVGIGFSLGANLLTKYMGEDGEDCLLSSGIAICCPFDMSIAGRALDADSFLNNRVFQPNLVATMKRYLTRNMEVFKSSEIKYDFEKLMKVKRMSEIDDLVTSKSCGLKDRWAYYEAASSTRYSCGLKDRWAYYEAASSTRYVDNIARPYLAINSLDDPVTPPEGIPMDKFKNNSNPNISLALTRHGGHLAFFSGISPTIWFVKPVIEYISAIIEN
ncbi:hypothetical protein GGI12_004449 [Dipsacomyces acuminosporus]|nr:hypothetical protein GGI12_004449 [Dipsacomyces acuminosporus]